MKKQFVLRSMVQIITSVFILAVWAFFSQNPRDLPFYVFVVSVVLGSLVGSFIYFTISGSTVANVFFLDSHGDTEIRPFSFEAALKSRFERHVFHASIPHEFEITERQLQIALYETLTMKVLQGLIAESIAKSSPVTVECSFKGLMFPLTLYPNYPFD